MAEGSIEVLPTGAQAPDFELRGTDGETYSLDDFADNEAVLLVFTCNHCPYAKAKFDHLNELAAESGDVAVVGVNPNANPDYPDDSFERMQELVEDGTIQYDAYLFDEDQTVAAEYGAVCTPDPFLLARTNGSFEVAFHSRLDDALNPDDEPTRREMREAIDALLAGDEIPLDENPSRGCSIKWRDGNEPDYWDQV
ncbi:MAG: thioredoxin family protein [Haloarculaceae archaeon]